MFGRVYGSEGLTFVSVVHLTEAPIKALDFGYLISSSGSVNLSPNPETLSLEPQSKAKNMAGKATKLIKKGNQLATKLAVFQGDLKVLWLYRFGIQCSILSPKRCLGSSFEAVRVWA